MPARRRPGGQTKTPRKPATRRAADPRHADGVAQLGSPFAPHVGDPLVGDRNLPTYLQTDQPLDSGRRMVSLIPGVAGTDELDEIPEQVLSFQGFLVPIGIAIREMNQIVNGRVMGMCAYTLTMNGELVYGQHMNSVSACILRLLDVVTRLTAHQVRWWVHDDWYGRQVWFEGVPARIASYSPRTGTVMLGAEPGWLFRPTAHEMDRLGQDDGVPVRMVDILDPSVYWTRTRPVQIDESEPGESENPPEASSDSEAREGMTVRTASVPPAVHSPDEAPEITTEPS